MKQQGYDKIYCYNHGAISETEAKRIALETDLHRFEPDTIDLANIFRELSKHFTVEEMTKTMPLKEKAIEAYIKYLDFDWDKLEAEYTAKKEKKKQRDVTREIKESSKTKKYIPVVEPSITYKRVTPGSFLNNL